MTESKSLPVLRAEVLFDQAFYLLQNEDVARQAGIDPISHFLKYGGLEGRDPHPLFDSSFYLERNPFLVTERINPLIHFLDQGASQGLDPHPLFSTAFYLEQGLSMEDCSFNPLIHYLAEGSDKNPHPLFDGRFYREQLAKLELNDNDINPLVHYLTVGNALGLQPSPAFDAVSYCTRYRDVALSGVNPLLHYVTQGKQEGRICAAVGSHTAKDTNYQTALCKILADTEKPFSHLIVTSCLARGGSERCVANFAAGIAQRVTPENLVILVTDFQSITCGDWLPRDVRIVNILDIDPELTEEQRGLLFLDLLMIRQPAFVLGMNAATFWNALDEHVGTWKGKLKTKLVGYLGHYEPFVNENDYGFIEGPLSRLIDDVHLFITDNIRLRDTMLELHKDKPNLNSKVTVCYKSLAEGLHNSLSAKAASRQGNFKRILWASRFTRVKQPHILWQIAERMPDLEFSVYGRKMPHIEDLSFLSPLPNVTLMGEYAGFDDIDTNDVGAFLYTSCADSMPHVLVEAGASGLPVVAPDIGAIRELIVDRTGWLLPESENVEDYVSALRYLQEHPQVAIERATNLKTLIDSRHNWSAFLDRLNQLDIWDSDHKQAGVHEQTLFDSEYYLAQNPDLAKADNLNPYRHFLEKGGLEGRDPHPLFDSSFYMENPEVAELRINPLAHFIHEGARRGFDPHPLFSVAYYLEQAPGIDVCSYNPLIHYLECGAESGLNPHPLFDSDFYARQVERLEGKPIACNPLVHYLSEGARLGLNPSPKFDGQSYYKQHPDVKEAGVNPLIHFVTVGQAEGRVSGANDSRRIGYRQRLRDLKITLLRKLGLDKRLAFRERITVLAEEFEIPIVQGYGAELLHFEPSFTYEVLDLLRNYLSIEDFVDVGAHIGQTLLEVRLTSSDIRYFGFEPNLQAYKVLTELIKANRFDCSVRQLGISDTQEVIPLFKGEPLDGAATILPSIRPGRYGPDDCEQIECVRLDDVEEIQSLHKHFILKIDVEGAELKVLRGARECISRLRPIIICEVLHAHDAQTLSQSRENKKQIQAYLDELNFLLYHIDLNPGQNHRQSMKSIRRISEFPVSIYSRSPHTCEYLFLPEELSNAIPF